MGETEQGGEGEREREEEGEKDLREIKGKELPGTAHSGGSRPQFKPLGPCQAQWDLDWVPAPGFHLAQILLWQASESEPTKGRSPTTNLSLCFFQISEEKIEEIEIMMKIINKTFLKAMRFLHIWISHERNCVQI